jgi:thiamine biosynthesis protein ThiI
VQIVVHYAEIGLKGRNRPRFETRLLHSLERSLCGLGRVRARRLFGRLLVDLATEAPFARVEAAIQRCFGVAYFGRVTRCEPTLPAISECALRSTEGQSFASFGVRARRADKSHAFNSRELTIALGSAIQERTGARVDLAAPDLWVEVHVLTRDALLLHERIPGPGGMPAGSAGRALSLISGGIDSPVASHAVIKRGARLDFVHFHSAPYTSAASVDKVRALVGRLSAYQGPSDLYVVPFGELQRALVQQAPAEPRIVLYRRFMLRIAERIAAPGVVRALVTGDSLGQVSSQTLGNIDTISRAARLPVLRPLIGMDKLEIVARARQIGTFEISIEADQDCCSFLQPPSPATWTHPAELEAVEAKLDVEGLLEATLQHVERERIESDA